MSKTCPQCKLTLCLSSFYKCAAAKDSHQSWCKSCSVGNPWKASPKGIRSNRRSTAVWEVKNPTKRALASQNNRLKSSYGITLNDYNNMRTRQNGLCAICQKPESLKRQGTSKALSVDHCHSSGAIRGLLCTACNLGLGAFKDNVLYLEKAIIYLNRDMRK